VQGGRYVGQPGLAHGQPGEGVEQLRAGMAGLNHLGATTDRQRANRDAIAAEQGGEHSHGKPVSMTHARIMALLDAHFP
jgi:hypothetical protein